MNGNPDKENDYYHYISGRFKIDQKPRYGGDGFNNVWDAAMNQNYMFPGDPRQPKPAWSEVSADITPGNRRGLGSIGPLNLKAGEVLMLDIAYIYARKVHTNYLDVFDDLNANADQVQQLYDQGKITNPFLTSINETKTKLAFNISPNPMESYTVITFNNPDNRIFNLQIADLFGKTVYENPVVKSDRIRISGNGIKPGFYIITLSNETSLGQMNLIVR